MAASQGAADSSAYGSGAKSVGPDSCITCSGKGRASRPAAGRSAVLSYLLPAVRSIGPSWTRNSRSVATKFRILSSAGPSWASFNARRCWRTMEESVTETAEPAAMLVGLWLLCGLARAVAFQTYSAPEFGDGSPSSQHPLFAAASGTALSSSCCHSVDAP